MVWMTKVLAALKNQELSIVLKNNNNNNILILT